MLSEQTFSEGTWKTKTFDEEDGRRAQDFGESGLCSADGASPWW